MCQNQTKSHGYWACSENPTQEIQLAWKKLIPGPGRGDLQGIPVLKWTRIYGNLIRD